MDWLKAHAYLAAWLALPLTLIAAMFQGAVLHKKVRLGQLVMYLAFLACIAAAFTPSIDHIARAFGGFFAFLLLIFIGIFLEKEMDQG